MNHKVSFQTGEWEQALFPNQSECHTVSSSFLRLFFTQPWVIFLTFMCWLLLCGRLTGDPLQISRSLFETLSYLLLCSTNSSFLVSPDCQLCLLNWRSPPGFVWLPLSWAEAYKLSQESKLWKYWGSPYLFIVSQGLLFFVAWYLVPWKPLLHTLFFLFYRFRRKFMQERVHSVGLSCSNPAHSPKRPIYRSGPSPTPENQADNVVW